MGALPTAFKQGKAHYVGISNYSPADTETAATALQEEAVSLLIHQPQ
jgi:L-glyceraldehyde 3-phosphate reductase